jgi:hypothetical protein
VTEAASGQGGGIGGRGSRTLLFAVARVVGWLIVPLYVAGVCTSYLLERSAGVLTAYPMEDVVIRVGFGAFAVVGSLLVAKRPTNIIGWIMATVALMAAILQAGLIYAAYVMATRGQPDALAVVGAWIGNWYWYLLLTLVVIYLPLLFPDGHLLSHRWLPVAVVPGIATLGIVVLGSLADTLILDPIVKDVHYRINNPIGIEGLGRLEDLPIFVVLNWLLIASIVGGVASVMVRFRRSRGVERQQMKWFVYAAALLLLAPVEGLLPEIVSNLLFGVVLIAIPTAIGIAVLKYRLYDIDLVINRTLVYGALTATLALIYFGGVATVQAVFRALTGEEQQPQLAVVVSTLVIAALFNPVRRRIQSFIDRRFYRRKYDAAKTLEAFSVKLRDETDLDALSDDLLEVVRETMQPAHVSLWLRPDPPPRTSEGREQVS